MQGLDPEPLTGLIQTGTGCPIKGFVARRMGYQPQAEVFLRLGSREHRFCIRSAILKCGFAQLVVVPGLLTERKPITAIPPIREGPKISLLPVYLPR